MEKYREFIQDRVRQAQRSKEEQKLASKCEHEWQTFRQSIPIDNLKFTKADAYFVVKGCHKCKTKLMVDYKTS